jgi:hypothetical protein
LFSDINSNTMNERDLGQMGIEREETYKQEFVKEKKWGVERELLSPKSNSLLKLVFRSSITITSKIYMRMR